MLNQNLKTMENTTPKIYVCTYKKYNEGSLFGEWVDLNQFSNSEEFYDYCKELHEDEDDAEFMFHDYEGIPEKFISESHLDDDYWDYQETINNCHNPEAMAAYVGEGYEASDFDEAYQGEFDSDEKFAEDFAEQVGAIDNNAQWPNSCIDWEWAARELMYDYFSVDGHYFRSL